MSKQPAKSPTQAILWSAAMFFAVAVAGHILFPAVELLWVIIGGCGLAAIPQAFLVGRGYGRRGRNE
jgi:hypothetical protein